MSRQSGEGMRQNCGLNQSHVDHFDELDIIELEFGDFSNRKSRLCLELKSQIIFMGLGYDHREGISKGRNYVFQQLKQKGNHHVIIFDHLRFSNKALTYCR